MRRRALSAVVPVCVGVVGLSVLLAAQGANTLRQTAFLKATSPDKFDHFGEGGVLDGHAGQGVAISADGNTIAVGAPHEASNARGIGGNQNDNSTYDAGAVYVFARNGAMWRPQAYVKASNPSRSAHFGASVALSADGSTMVVGAPWESSGSKGINSTPDTSLPQAGAVYVFTRSGTTWSQQAYIKSSNAGQAGEEGDGDQFGFSVAISGDGSTIAAGANSEDSNATGINGNQNDDSASSAGAVYVFGRTGTTWTQQAYIKSDSPAMAVAGIQFGYSLALNRDGTTLAVGVYDERGGGRAVNAPIDNGRGGSGAVYVYRRAGTAWAREAYLKTWNSEGGDSWGVSVALSEDGNTLATGSHDEDCLCKGVATDPSIGSTDQKADLSTGGVAVFVRSGATWTQQAYVKASNTGTRGDWFGARLSVSGDGNTLAVGAQNEDGNAKGINGSQDNDAAEDAGAVYLFTRTGTAWSQIAYVKGSNTEAYDEFGSSVALSRDGRTMAVGARGEDSGANGNQADNSVDEAGAVYVFTR